MTGREKRAMMERKMAREAESRSKSAQKKKGTYKDIPPPPSQSSKNIKITPKSTRPKSVSPAGPAVKGPPKKRRDPNMQLLSNTKKETEAQRKQRLLAEEAEYEKRYGKMDPIDTSAQLDWDLFRQKHKLPEKFNVFETWLDSLSPEDEAEGRRLMDRLEAERGDREFMGEKKFRNRLRDKNVSWERKVDQLRDDQRDDKKAMEELRSDHRLIWDGYRSYMD